MTTSELRDAARSAAARAVQASDGETKQRARRSAAAYAVEAHKKYALAGACLTFALVGAAFGLRFPGEGIGFVIGTTLAVLSVFYVGLIGGEELGDRLMVSPFWAMWTPTLVAGAVGLLVLQGGRIRRPSAKNDLAGEAATHMSPADSKTLATAVRRQSHRARWAIGFLLAIGVLDAVGAIDAAFALEQLGRLPDAAAAASTDPATLAGGSLRRTLEVLQITVLLAAALSFLLWFYAAYGNVRLVGSRVSRTSPSWAVGCWFVPFVNVFRPYEAVVETWQRSEHGNAHPSTRGLAAPRVVGWWWGALLLSKLLSLRTIDVMEAAQTTSQLTAGHVLLIAAHAVSVVAAALAVGVVASIDRRQRGLIRALT